ncbi:MAG: DUF885 domain-containing protein [Holophagales bacterium]|nr:DUF885 domain-containing protein [Holophagales bacterium]MBK9967479.1 DUF885 domain-containing protein [Holophagales bacterium]
MSAAPPSAVLADLAARHWEFLCHELPLTAVLAGESTPDSVLFRESPADHERRYRTARVLLAEVEAIPADGLEAEDRATHALLRHELGSLRALHEVAEHLRPSLFPNSPALMAAHFANTASIDDAASAERYVDRLATLPAYLRDLKERLEEGRERGFRYPRRVLDLVAGSTRGIASGPVEAQPWLKPFQRSAAAGREMVRNAASRAEALARNELLPAFEEFAAFVEGPLAEGARETVTCTDAPLGRELYRALLKDQTTLDLGPEEIHELGLSERKRLEGEIEAVAAEAGFPGDVAGYRRFLAGAEFLVPSKEALRERAQVLCKRIDARIPAFFGLIPRMTYGVETIPEAAAERLPPAYAQANPADRTGPGIFQITSLPARLPTWFLPALTLHEAWPGHLMHLALLQEAEHLPAFRRHGALRYLVCLEGWALYCEGLGEEMGIYETPHERYGRLEGETWRALRLVVDTGIHWYGWSRERAVEEMARHLALPLPTIEAEVDRYIAWPGQALVYQLGNLKFRELRRRAEGRLGERFRIRAFHDALMAAGAVTLPVLDDLVEEWLRREDGPTAEDGSTDGLR